MEWYDCFTRVWKRELCHYCGRDKNDVSVHDGFNGYTQDLDLACYGRFDHVRLAIIEDNRKRAFAARQKERCEHRKEE